MIRYYHEFILVQDDVKRSRSAVTQFSTHVFDSPAGQAEKKDVVSVPAELAALVRKLEGGLLDADRDAQRRLGVMLADLLLPGSAQGTSTRELFHESLSTLREDEGLRIRVRAPVALAFIPWEFSCIPRSAGRSPEFLLFDRRVSLVRDDALTLPALPGDRHSAAPRRRVVYAAAPGPFEGYEELVAIAGEKKAVRKAISGTPGIDLVCLPASKPPAGTTQRGTTLEQLAGALDERTDILHFSGHGEFEGAKLAGGP
jgi:hypothetical protein